MYIPELKGNFARFLRPPNTYLQHVDLRSNAVLAGRSAGVSAPPRTVLKPHFFPELKTRDIVQSVSIDTSQWFSGKITYGRSASKARVQRPIGNLRILTGISEALGHQSLDDRKATPPTRRSLILGKTPSA